MIRASVKQLFGKYLLYTNTASTGLLLGLGDYTVQHVYKHIGERDKIDPKSIGCLAAYGAAIGPPLHYWYKALDRLFPGSGPRVVIKKLAPDLLLCGPFLIATFFVGVGYLEGKNLRGAWLDLKQNFIFVYKADLSFWTVAQAVNFTFVPTQFRVLYVAACSYIWDCFLAYVKHTVISPSHQKLIDTGDIDSTSHDVNVVVKKNL